MRLAKWMEKDGKSIKEGFRRSPQGDYQSMTASAQRFPLLHYYFIAGVCGFTESGHETTTLTYSKDY